MPIRFLLKVFKKVGIGFFTALKKIWMFFNKHLLLSCIILTPIFCLISYWMFKNLWSDIFNCNYLITKKLGAPKEISEGIHIDFLGIHIPGLGSLLNPVLEFIRKLSIVIILFFIGVLSFICNFIFTKFKLIIKLVTFDKEQWRRFLSGYRVFLLTFVCLCTMFLLSTLKIF